MPDSNELCCKIPEKKKDNSYSIFQKHVNFNKSSILIVGNSNFHVHYKMRGREMLMQWQEGNNSIYYTNLKTAIISRRYLIH